MRALRERPRVVITAALALVGLVLVSASAGGALLGDRDDRPAADTSTQRLELANRTADERGRRLRRLEGALRASRRRIRTLERRLGAVVARRRRASPRARPRKRSPDRATASRGRRQPGR